MTARRGRRINLRRVSDTRVGISLDETTTRAISPSCWPCSRKQRSASEVPHIDALDAERPRKAPCRPKAGTHQRVPHASGVQPSPFRNGNAALPAQPVRQGPGARPLDDPARLVHDEAERDLRNAAGHVARIRQTIHPFAPAEQTVGYALLIGSSSRCWWQVTGYAAVSLQPNAGSQGEYAGLLIIHAYHASRGEGASQHLPDPVGARHEPGVGADGRHAGRGGASASRQGNVDIADLKAKAAARGRAGRDDDHVPVHARRVRERCAKSARSCTRTAARCTSTAPT
jgi:glycine dehydrogenase